jgi:hypothetical protein
MQWRLKELLEHTRKHPVTPKVVHGGDWKKCVATRDFEDEGKMYLAKRDRKAADEILTFDAVIARRLVSQGKVVIAQGGYCDTQQVQIGPGNALFAFWPWEEPNQFAAAGEYDRLLLRVRLRKYVTVIPTVKLVPGDEFFVPYKLINQIGCTLSDDPSEFPAPLILLTNQEPYAADSEAKT